MGQVRPRDTGAGLLLPLPRTLSLLLRSPVFKCSADDEQDDLSIPRLPGPRKPICPVLAQSARPQHWRLLRMQRAFRK